VALDSPAQDAGASDDDEVVSPDSTLPAETMAAIDRLEPADVVIGMTACTTPAAVRAATAAATAAGRRSSPALRTVLVHPDVAAFDDGLVGWTPGPEVQILPCRLPAIGRLPFAAADGIGLFLPLSIITSRVGARACGLTGALPEGITSDALRLLVAPILERAIDLVLPRYPRHRLDGLISRGIVYPLTRALYGLRAEGQLGIDFGLSPGLLAALSSPHVNRGSGRPIWLLTEAAERGMAVGQACLGAWLPPVEPPTDVSTALTQVLGSLFDDMEQHAAVWQRLRGSQSVATFGEVAEEPDEPRSVDTRAMIESFQIGFRNLQEVWARVFPPAQLLELHRMTRLAPDAFRMPDALWARIVFDVALGYRLRIVSRDHLLRAMTPLYLAWVASFVLAVGDAGRDAARTRLEALCAAYEAEKPYLLARWRWPDRFNP